MNCMIVSGKVVEKEFEDNNYGGVLKLTLNTEEDNCAFDLKVDLWGKTAKDVKVKEGDYVATVGTLKCRDYRGNRLWTLKATKVDVLLSGEEEKPSVTPEEGVDW